MPVLAETIGSKKDGDDNLVKVRVSSLDNPISSKSASVRGAARALIESGMVNPTESRPLQAAFENRDIISTINQKVVEGEAPNRIRTAEITYRVRGK